MTLDPFFGRYHSQSAVEWLDQYGEQLRFTIMDWCQDLYGYSALPTPTVFSEMMLDAQLTTLTELRGVILSILADAAEEIADAEGDTSLVPEMKEALDISALTFASRWSEFSARLTAIQSTMGQPKKILPSNATRPLTNMEAAKYMGFPSHRDRQRASEFMKKREKDGIPRTRVGNRHIYRISDFPEEYRDYVRPR